MTEYAAVQMPGEVAFATKVPGIFFRWRLAAARSS